MLCWVLLLALPSTTIGVSPNILMILVDDVRESLTGKLVGVRRF
jgi:hypothetical protein